MLSILFFSLIIGDSYSYDEYSYCDRQARTARVLDLVPTNCEMSTYGFCYEKGQDYPDKAIRRFLKENLGLMKRMTSDLDSREVVREMRSGFNMWTQSEHYDDEEVMLDGDEAEGRASSFQMHMMPPGENIFNGLAYNIKYGSGLATIKNVRDENMKEMEEETTGTTTRTTTSQSTMIVTTVQSSTTTSSMGTETSTQPAPSTQTNTWKDSSDYIEPSTVTETMQTSTMMDSTEMIQETTFEAQETPTEPPVTQPEEFYPDEYYSEYPEYSQPSELPVQSAQVQPQEVREQVQEADYLEEVLEEINETELEQEEKLIQEVEEVLVEEIIPEEIDYTGESVNACEVEVSISAPYWATNTRNDTLTLLNLYPFEQYIHMEICKAEHQEMLCRPGCRCEQQYRLHRLLAFDPTNECRGIFSDWFRFPSFCICKCYNSARQFKELTRNPKSHGVTQSRKSAALPTNSRLNNHRLMSVSGMDNMPAVFPYEGLAMITEEQNQRQRDDREFRVPRGMTAPLATDVEKDSQQSEDKIMERIADEHMDNTVESDQVHFMKNQKQGRFLDESFFYNQPIVDFKLSDGTMGSVEQVPRK